MIKLLSKVRAKGKRMLAVAGAGVVSVITMALAVGAEGETSTETGIGSIVETAGQTLTDEFQVLATTLVPVLLGIGIVGLGLYACIYLFKMAKKFFGQAAK